MQKYNTASSYGNINDLKVKAEYIQDGKLICADDTTFILMRDCFMRIYSEMKRIIQIGSNSKFQKCFLVYGNEKLGKTILSCFLAYCFNMDKYFKEYNIILFYVSTNEHTCYYFREAYGVRFEETEKLPSTKRKTIIISDNFQIREDEFSNDEVVIMISSPNSSKYKIMSNKRAPIQFYITQFSDKERKIYNGFTRSRLPSFQYANARFDKNDGLPVFIPQKYNQKCFIYDVDKVNAIPDRLKFLSDEIAKQILYYHFNETKYYEELYNVFMKGRNGNVFERMIHIIFANCRMDNELIFIPENKCYIHNKIDFDHISDSKKDEIYIDFSEISNFPAIDGCIINRFNVTPIQMTIDKDHPTVNTVIVLLNMFFNHRKDKIKEEYLKGFNSSNDEYRKVISSSLYQNGYIPSQLKEKYILLMDERKRILCESYFLINEITCRKYIQSDLINIYEVERIKQFQNIINSDVNTFNELNSKLNNENMVKLYPIIEKKIEDNDIISLMEGRINTLTFQIEILNNGKYQYKNQLLIWNNIAETIKTLLSKLTIHLNNFSSIGLQNRIVLLLSKIEELKITTDKFITNLSNEIPSSRESFVKQFQTLNIQPYVLSIQLLELQTRLDVLNRKPQELSNLLISLKDRILHIPFMNDLILKQLKLYSTLILVLQEKLSDIVYTVKNKVLTLQTLLHPPQIPMLLKLYKQLPESLSEILQNQMSEIPQVQILKLMNEISPSQIEILKNQIMRLMNDIPQAHIEILQSHIKELKDNIQPGFPLIYVTTLDLIIEELQNEIPEVQMNMLQILFQLSNQMHTLENQLETLTKTNISPSQIEVLKNQIMRLLNEIPQAQIEILQSHINEFQKKITPDQIEMIPNIIQQLQNEIPEVQMKILQYEIQKLKSQLPEDSIKTIQNEIQTLQNQLSHSNINLQNEIQKLCNIPELNQLDELMNEFYIMEKQFRSLLQLLDTTNSNELLFESKLYGLYNVLQKYLEEKIKNDEVKKLSNDLHTYEEKLLKQTKYALYSLDYQLLFCQKQLQLVDMYDIEEANELIKISLNTVVETIQNDNINLYNRKILHDLNDYLVDEYYNNLDVNRKGKMKIEIINSITNSNINEAINELEMFNPIFNIVYVSYDSDQVRDSFKEGSVNFDLYGKFKNKMIMEMKNNYNWIVDSAQHDTKRINTGNIVLSVDQMKIIIAIKSKRLRFSTLRMGLIELREYLKFFVGDKGIEKRYIREKKILEFQPKEYSSLLIKKYEQKKDIPEIVIDRNTFSQIFYHPNTIERDLTNCIVNKMTDDDKRTIINDEWRKINDSIELDPNNEKVKKLKELNFNSCNSEELDVAFNTIKEMKGSLYKYCKSCTKTNSLCKVFDRPVTIDGDNIINIDCDIYQYPQKKVYIRDIYKDIWNEIKKYILFVKLRFFSEVFETIDKNRLLTINIIINELNEWIKEKNEYYTKYSIGNNIKLLNNISNFEEFNETVKTAYIEIVNEDEENIDLGEKINILLRGNPGCGKTSFIIYLLQNLIDLNDKLEKEMNKLNEVLKFPIQTLVFKKGRDVKCNRYALNNKRVYEKYGDTYCDIAISDSYNLEKGDIDAEISLYITSPDYQNYDNFYDTDGKKVYYYMDVFSEKEIEEWERYCLPDDLKEIAKCNNSRYGNVPRHIYYAAIYDVCYKKDYWDEIYTVGIKRIIGDLGYIEFLITYLYLNEPNKNKEEEEIKISEKRTVLFDSTLSHYLVKYSIPFKVEDESTKCYDRINEYELEFISDEVFDYIYDCIRHKAEENDVKTIQQLLKDVSYEQDHQLFILLFQELVWYNCLYHTDMLEGSLGVKLERIKDDEFEEFKELFDGDIYSTKKEENEVSKENEGELYLLHLATLKNKEMIYLLNNCFIHIMNENENENENENVEDRYDLIKKCMICLKIKMKWSDFYYISFSPKEASIAPVENHISSSHLIGIKNPQNKNKGKMTVEEVFSPTKHSKITKFFIDETEIPLSGYISFHLSKCQLNRDMYGRGFSPKVKAERKMKF